MRFFRSSLFYIGYNVLTIAYGTLALFLWLVPPLVRHKTICTWTSASIWWLKVTCGVRYELHGVKNMKAVEGSFVALSKHQSTWETLFLQSLFWPSSTILKKELLNIPFFGWGLRAMSPIPIDRSHPKEALKQVKSQGCARLSEGQNLILFPEGTRVAPGEKGKYARSGAEIAKTAGVKIVPIAHNAGLYWPSNTFIKIPGTVQIIIGEAISTEGKTTREIIEETEYWIEKTTTDLCKKDINSENTL